MLTQKYLQFIIYVVLIICISCINNTPEQKINTVEKIKSIPVTTKNLLKQPKTIKGKVVGSFETFIGKGNSLSIEPQVTKKSLFEKPVPLGLGVLPSGVLKENSISFSTSQKLLSLASLKQTQSDMNKTSNWVFNSIGDTVKTGVPLYLTASIQDRIQLPRKKTLTPSYQNTSIPFNARLLDVTDGMLTSYIYCVFQDSKERIWIGTYNGLSMYDGQNITHYTKEQGLPSNFIYKISEDTKGQILIGTRAIGTKGGLSIYDGLQFKNISEKEGLSNHSITAIYPDQKGGFWLGTRQGIIYSNGTSYTHYTTHEGLPNNIVNDITGDDQGTIYIGTQKGLAVFNGTEFKSISTQQGLLSNSILALFVDSNARLWIGSREGVQYYDGRILFTLGKHVKNLKVISSFAEDQNKTIWMASTLNGMFKYQNDQLFSYTKKNGFINNDISQLCVDTDNNLWFSSDGGGLGIFKDDSFSYLTAASGILPPLYTTLMEDSHKNIWIGTQKSGISIIKNDTIFNLTKENGLLSNAIFDLVEDHQGSIWIASKRGISYYDGKILKNYTEKNGLSSASVNSIFLDKNQDMWVGTSKGITLFKPDEIHYYNAQNGFIDNTINCITSDAMGNIWIGTNNGLARYDGNSFTYFSEKEGLNISTITSLFSDASGVLWIGTLGGGVLTFDGSTFTRYTTQDGLSDNVVWSLQSDNENNIWASTEKGLTFFHRELKNTSQANTPKVLSIRAYYESDGLPELSFYQGDALLDSQGVLWWSNAENITKKLPNKRLQQTKSPEIFLNRIELNETFYDFHNIEDQSQLPFSFSKTLPFYNIPENLVADPSQKQCSFFFSGIDWKAPHNLKYSHKIEELNQAWSKPSSETKADYRNLSHGAYTFKVKVIGEAGIWSPEYRYSFKILPHWWHTWWARFGYVMLALLLVYTYIKYRLRTLQFRAEQLTEEVHLATKEIRLQKEEIEGQKLDLEEANAMKDKMFSVIAHDLRAPFGQLKMGLMLLEKTNLSEEEQKEIVEMLGRDHENTSALLDNLLKWAITQKGEMIYQPESTDICELIRENIRLFSKQATRKNIRLIYKIPEALFAFFDVNMIQTVLRNLTSNAIKFSKAGDTITVFAKKQKHDICISVADTGIGIPENKLEDLFKKNMHFTTHGTDNEKGSGLGLSLCYDLVTKNKGRIEVLSIVNKGTTFTFTLPISK